MAVQGKQMRASFRQLSPVLVAVSLWCLSCALRSSLLTEAGSFWDADTFPLVVELGSET